MAKIEVICWDLDNTIIPSKQVAIEIMDKLLPKHGVTKRPSYDEHHHSFGMPLEEFIKLHSGNHPNQTLMLEQFLEAQQDYYKSDIDFFEGVLDTISHFSRRGYTQVLITSRRHKGRKLGSPENILRKLGVLDYFSLIISGDDVSNHKPHPEPMQRVLLSLKIEPQAVVMIGDQAVDMQMAKTAECLAIGIDHEANPDFMASLWEAGADHVVSSATSLQVAVEELEKIS